MREATILPALAGTGTNSRPLRACRRVCSRLVVHTVWTKSNLSRCSSWRCAKDDDARAMPALKLSNVKLLESHLAVRIDLQDVKGP